MAWIEASVVAQRAAFVAAVMSGETPMNWLCADYGISRKTGYKWLERYAAEGARGCSTGRGRRNGMAARRAPRSRKQLSR